MKKTIKQFCTAYGITEKQFKGIDTVGGSLDLGSVTSIPEGFNPTVGGSLDLGSVTSIPEGFNPTVGGYLDLRSVTSIPEGFNPTVGGSLELGSVTSIPKGFNKNNYQNKPSDKTKLMTWQNGKYIKADDRFSEVISKKGNVWKLKDVNKNNEYYLVTDNRGRYAHGNTIKEAKEDLIYKINDRDKTKYEGISKAEKFPFEYCVEMYRVITGACATGTKHFIESTGVKKSSYSVNEIAKMTVGSYGNSDFKQFFNIK